jgi:signal transduction histidine kinase
LIHDITAQKKAENDIIELNKALEDRVKRRTAELQKANEELKQSIAIRQELEKERKQHHQALLNAVIQGQDQERQRIASELHEGLGQTMYAVKLYFESFLKKIQKGEAPSQEMIDSIKSFLDQTIDEVRSISHFLRPGFIADIGLTAAIVTLCNKLSASSSVQIHCTILEEPQGLGLNEQTSIYRIVQEILTNALKHAKPETIDITIGKTDNGMSLIITDDGLGFDLEAARKKEGIGLKNLTARVELLGGEIEINTAIGKGTQILIEIPLPVTAQKKVNAAGKNKKKLKNSSK